MRRVPLVVVSLFLGALLAGCTTQRPQSGYSPGAGSPAQVAAPTRHDWASNSPIAVSAGTVFAHPFELKGSIDVTYSFAVRDDSSEDIAFILASDLAEYRQGQQVTGWAAQHNTQGTTQHAVLPTGDYDLVIKCRNSFADCDLNYSLWAVY